MQLFDADDTLWAISQIFLSPFGLVLLGLLAVRVGIELLAPPRRRRRPRRSYRPGSWRRDLLAVILVLTGLWAIGPGMKIAGVTSGSSITTTISLSPLESAFSCLLPFAWAGAIAALVAGRRHIYRLEGLRALSPDDFEDFVANLFRKQGYKAKVIGGGGDHGVDITLTNPQGERELVQCKRWDNKWLGEGVVRDFFGAFVHDGDAVRGYIVTTSFFSDAARAWAEGKPIDLIDGKRLAEAVRLIG